MEDNVLELCGLTKQFGGLVAVNNLSLAMKKRSIHALIGPNGSGKTTTVDIINGVLPATDGQIFFYGEKISGLKGYRIANKGIGRTFQNIKLFHTMTVLENLMVGGHTLKQDSTGFVKYLFNITGSIKEEKMIKEKAESVLEFIGMKDYGSKRVGDLAYGRQKVTELGRALMTDPKLIFLDEPAAGLDPEASAEMNTIISELNSNGVTIILVSHDLSSSIKDASHILHIENGAALFFGTKADYMNSGLGRVYVNREDTIS